MCTFLTTPWNVLRLICTFVGFNEMTQLPSSRYACSIPSKELIQPRWSSQMLMCAAPEGVCPILWTTHGKSRDEKLNQNTQFCFVFSSSSEFVIIWYLWRWGTFLWWAAGCHPEGPMYLILFIPTPHIHLLWQALTLFPSTQFSPGWGSWLTSG